VAKFVLITIGLMSEITDADALREAALKKFDAAGWTSDDHPDTADWHAPGEGQQDRRPHDGRQRTDLRLAWSAQLEETAQFTRGQ
jgi:hypothetical protein